LTSFMVTYGSSSPSFLELDPTTEWALMVGRGPWPSDTNLSPSERERMYDLYRGF
jgi:hypothetical protein